MAFWNRYSEKVLVPKEGEDVYFFTRLKKKSPNVCIADIVITNASKSSDRDFNGNVLGLDHTATLFVQSDYFCVTSITIENGAIPDGKIEGNQAVALRVDGDKAMFYRVRMLGYQDTLWDNVGTHYFYRCFNQAKEVLISFVAKQSPCTRNVHSIQQ